MSTYEDGWRDCALSLAAEFIKIGAENRDPLTSSAYYHAALVARQLQDGPEAHGSPSPVSLDPAPGTETLREAHDVCLSVSTPADLTDKALAAVNRLHDLCHPSVPGGVYDPDRNPGGCDKAFCCA